MTLSLTVREIFVNQIISLKTYFPALYHGITVGKQTSILYSPQIRYSTETFRIFQIFSTNIWILLLLSYVCLVAINSYKYNILIISKLFIDYFALFTFESKNTVCPIYTKLNISTVPEIDVGKSTRVAHKLNIN